LNVIGSSFDPHTPGPAPFGRITVIGGGAWGTALASIAARAGRQVTLWCRSEETAADINLNRRNARYLGDTELPAEIAATTDFAAALAEAEVVLLVTPSRTVREMSARIARHAPEECGVVLCAKGIEAGSGKLLTDVATEELGARPVGVLSGPTFAIETALGYPTAATIASAFEPGHAPHETLASRLAVSIGSEVFRPYVSDDIVGVEVGGAMKNVVAIACGMMIGAGFAENTRAAIITRGLDEMKGLAEALGGRRETVTGLSGIGDLTLTCSSTKSRNMSLGMQLGEGTPRDACFDGRPVVVEGEINARSVTDLARLRGVELPICEAVRAILFDGAPIGETFATLWSRPIQAEPRSLDLEFAHPADDAAVQRFAEMIR